MELQLLSTSSINTCPCIVLSTEAHRYIIDAGEGLQRLCIEHKVRLMKLNAVFLSRLSPETNSGLPGMMLTAIDCGKNDLDLIGPVGLRAFYHSTRHWMRRPNYNLRITELPASAAHELSPEVTVSGEVFAESASLRKGSNLVTRIETTRRETESEIASASLGNGSHCAYIFSTPIQPGKFDAEAAKQLGIPPGPLYALLKAGQIVDAADRDPSKLYKHVTVHPSQVVGPNIPPRYFIVVTKSLVQESSQLDCIVHFSPKHVIGSESYVNFMQQFGTVTHIFAGKSMAISASSFIDATRYSQKLRLLLPKCFANMRVCDFHLPLKQISTSIPMMDVSESVVVRGYPLQRFTILPRRRFGLNISTKESNGHNDESTDVGQLLCRDIDENIAKDIAAFHAELNSNDEVLSPLIVAHDANTLHSDTSAERESVLLHDNVKNIRIWFLGTGSAIPSKYRNVTGMLLQLPFLPTSSISGGDDGQSSLILLDCGEGSWMQMYSERAVQDQLLLQLGAAWISHPHADHFLGLTRVLAERQRLRSSLAAYRASAGADVTRCRVMNPLVVIAPPAVLRYLDDYALSDASIADSYIAVSNYWIDPAEADGPPEVLQEVKRLLGDMRVTKVQNCRVDHCPESYVLSEKTEIETEQNLLSKETLSIVYSGDARPCNSLVDLGEGADILIHEASFDDSKFDEAQCKRHSTISEAIYTGLRIGALRTILTHFSQRYPGVPPQPHPNISDMYTRHFPANVIEKYYGTQSVLSFDFMSIMFSDLQWLPVANAVLLEAFKTAAQEEADNEEPALSKRSDTKTKNGSQECFSKVPSVLSSDKEIEKPFAFLNRSRNWACECCPDGNHLNNGATGLK
eukprot:GSChrysophyteH1.ASY1.ANO1.2045.1 assembled CDS